MTDQDVLGKTGQCGGFWSENECQLLKKILMETLLHSIALIAIIPVTSWISALPAGPWVQRHSLVSGWLIGLCDCSMIPSLPAFRYPWAWHGSGCSGWTGLHFSPPVDSHSFSVVQVSPRWLWAHPFRHMGKGQLCRVCSGSWTPVQHEQSLCERSSARRARVPTAVGSLTLNCHCGNGCHLLFSAAERAF